MRRLAFVAVLVLAVAQPSLGATRSASIRISGVVPPRVRLVKHPSGVWLAQSNSKFQPKIRVSPQPDEHGYTVLTVVSE